MNFFSSSRTRASSAQERAPLQEHVPSASEATSQQQSNWLARADAVSGLSVQQRSSHGIEQAESNRTSQVENQRNLSEAAVLPSEESGEDDDPVEQKRQWLRADKSLYFTMHHLGRLRSGFHSLFSDDDAASKFSKNKAEFTSFIETSQQEVDAITQKIDGPGLTTQDCLDLLERSQQLKNDIKLELNELANLGIEPDDEPLWNRII